MDIEATLKAGDICFDCQKLGLEKHLRYFKININGDTLLKCESNECMFPHNDEISSSSDEDENGANNFLDTSSENFINNFIQQCSNDEIQNINKDFSINENHSDQIAQFDIKFLDDLGEIETKNLCKPEVSTETVPLGDNKSNNNSLECKYFPQPNLNSLQGNLIEGETGKEQHENKISHSNIIDNIIKDCKEKITIQSIETIKFETPLSNLFSSPKTIDSDPMPTSTTTKKKSSKKTVSKKSPLKTKIKNDKNKAEINKTSTPSKLPRSNKKSLKKSIEIPKADIIKGNALLKQFVGVHEKPVASARINKCVRGKQAPTSEDIKKLDSLIPSQSTEVGYSIEKIENLIANKTKSK